MKMTCRVIAATNRPGAVDPALRRPGRLDLEVEVPPPNTQQRAAILALHTAALPLAADVRMGVLAERSRGYTAADLAAVCREAAMAAIVQAGAVHASAALPESVKGGASEGEDACVCLDHFDRALARVKPSLVRGLAVETPAVAWSAIGGLPVRPTSRASFPHHGGFACTFTGGPKVLQARGQAVQEVKERLRQSVEWPLTRRAACERLGINTPQGILLHGPPGCCKTTLARAVATASSANIIPLAASSLYSMCGLATCPRCLIACDQWVLKAKARLEHPQESIDVNDV